MRTSPFSFTLDRERLIPETYDKHIQRRLSQMAGQYLDGAAYASLRKRGDPVVYDVYEIVRPSQPGELAHGVTILHPGKVGNEYAMTKGHFHAVLETAEVYNCLKGEGYMVMETPEGECAAERFNAGQTLYVPPGWAHRSVNVSPTEPLVFLFVYPAYAGHDYGTIEERGFRKLVVEREGRPVIIDNPRWTHSARTAYPASTI